MRGKLQKIHAASTQAKTLIGSTLMVTILGMGLALDNIPPKPAMADAGTRVVSVYFDGQKKVATTDAATVGEFLQRANIIIEEGDRVEPAPETAIPAGFFNINVFRGEVYRIVDGNSTVLVRSAQQTPRLVAADAGITLYEEDRANIHQVNDFIGSRVVGQNIVVDRALPLTLSADGTSRTVRTHGSTVRELLAEQGVVLGADDSITPAIDAGLTEGAHIKITRVSVAVSTKEEVVAKKVVKKADASMLRGSSRVEQEGKDGRREVTYQTTYHNGQVVASKELKSVVLERPIDRVEVVGTRILFANEVIAMAAQLAGERGWVEEQWDALHNLWQRESNFNPNAVNPSSGACGIPQALPCSKITDKSPEGQIRWGLGYIANRYGDPVNAWNFWKSHRWY